MDAEHGVSRPRLCLAVGLISGAALALEVLLLRLFSITHWHHFAYMVISVALLGYGASGVFVTLARAALLARFGAVFRINAALFAVAAVPACAVALRLPFNALEVVWDIRQWAWLAAIYALLVLPFFFASNCVCLALSGHTGAVARLYAADLAGAGAGALAVVLLLWWLPDTACLLLIGVAGLAAMVLAPPPDRARRVMIVVAAPAVAALLAWVLALLAPGIAPGPYKALSQALQVIGARLVYTDSSPFGRLAVLDSPVVPLRHVPGLSLANEIEPPAQLGVFIDGQGPAPITRFRPGHTDLSYLDAVPQALAYHLRPHPRVLVLGAGGGAEVLQAVHFGARAIDAVELNPQVVALLHGPFAAYSGELARRPEVRLHAAEARSYVERSTARYEVVIVPPLDAFGAAAAGAYALHESYVYTVEALQRYLQRLAPGGVLALLRWVKLPPRDGPRLFATAVAALERNGVTEPGRRLAWLRSWNLQLLLVGERDWNDAELERIRRFCAERWFDLAWLPGLQRAQANRYTVLDEPRYFDAATALLGERRRSFMAGYAFDLTPPTDARPYFFSFFRWSQLPALAALPARGGWAQIDIGYPVLVATLGQALAASAVLILAPLALAGRRRRFATAAGGPRRAPVVAYFACLGLGFMFVEIAFIARLGLYLGNPLYSVAVVLTGFLVFAGLGASWIDRRASGSAWRRCPLRAALLVVAAVAAVSAAVPGLHAATAHLPDLARGALALATLAPLAFVLGMPFPIGLALIGARAPALVPWAWAINGCASVTGAVLATLIAIHFGHAALLVLAALLYLLAAAVRFDRARA